MNKVLLLGIGNVLWADEGFGVRVIEYILKNYTLHNNVTVLDGGTQGMYLLEYIQQCEILIIFDAIDFSLPAGTLHIIYNDDVPQFMGAKKLSLHQTGFSDVLATAQMLGQYPKELVLIGVQPVELEDYGGSLREPVKQQIIPAIHYALSYLAQFNITLEPIFSENIELTDPVLNMARYENERPDENIACRIGDERILNLSNL